MHTHDQHRIVWKKCLEFLSKIMKRLTFIFISRELIKAFYNWSSSKKIYFFFRFLTGFAYTLLLLFAAFTIINPLRPYVCPMAATKVSLPSQSYICSQSSKLYYRSKSSVCSPLSNLFYHSSWNSALSHHSFIIIPVVCLLSATKNLFLI